MVKSQRKWNIGFMLFLTLLLVLLFQIDLQLTLISLLSIAIGFALQKSRFCFVAAFRDPIITGITELTQAVIILLAISIVGFAVVIWLAPFFNLYITLHVFPLGINTIVGGILFGIGMVIAGGCVTGVLMRIGEGFAMQLVAFLGLLIGALAGKRSQQFWKNLFGEMQGIFLPDILGWIPALAVELLLLFMLWKIARWWQNRQIRG